MVHSVIFQAKLVDQNIYKRQPNQIELNLLPETKFSSCLPKLVDLRLIACFDQGIVYDQQWVSRYVLWEWGLCRSRHSCLVVEDGRLEDVK